jgi:hypothetical protein
VRARAVVIDADDRRAAVPAGAHAVAAAGWDHRDARADARRPAGAAASFRAAIRYCLQRSQLRLTVPTGLLVGAALTLVNQGGMLLHGGIDVGMCAICSLDFLLPFVALNVALVAASRRARFLAHWDEPIAGRTGSKPQRSRHL